MLQITTICVLVTVLCISLSSAQGPAAAQGAGGRRRQRGGGGGGEGRWGDGPFGDSGPAFSAIMNDPFAFRRWSHPLANQRFMNSFLQPNFATLMMMGDMEPMDALLFGAMSMGMQPRGPRGRRLRPLPLLAALGIGDGLDIGENRPGERRRRPAAKAPAAKAAGPSKARRGARAARRSEAGAAGQSEVV